MTKRQRDLLAIRFVEIEHELEAIAEGRVVEGDPATLQGELLDEPRTSVGLTE